ncbi:7332_t:CDS:2, partial [Funneliformis caledonium]
MCGVYGSPNSLHQCHFCLVQRNMMNDVHIAKEDIYIHNENDTKNALRCGKDKAISVYNIRNALWKRPYFNVYTMCVPDCMHYADFRLFQYQLRFTVELLNSKYNNSLIRILEECLFQIPRYLNLKVFKNRFERFTRLTAAEYRDLMKVMLFVLDDLISDKKLNENLCELYSLWIDMYIWSRQPKYTENIKNWSLQDIDNETVQIEVFEQAAFSDVCVEIDKAEQDDYLTDNGLCYAK